MKRLLSFLLMLFLLVSLGLSAHAAGAGAEPSARYSPYEGDYLYDRCGLLTQIEQAALEDLAKRASKEHDCGLYIMLVEDFRTLNANNDIFKAAYTYYHDNKLGMGGDRDGVFLLLSMSARDFAFFVYGEKAEYALDSWGQQKLEEAFIDDLGDNRWYDGLEDFVTTCDEFLTLAEEGKPVRESPLAKMGLSAGISSFIALLGSSFLWNKNKGAKKRRTAREYVYGTLIPGISEDRYIQTTVTRRIIESDSASSGSSVARSGGGGSGRSGKF